MNRENLTDTPLTLQKYEGTELEHYLETRYDKAPVPYTPPASEVQPYNATKAVQDLVKPVVILSALAGGVYMVVVVAFAVGAAILSTVAAYAVPIGGAAAAVVTLVLCFGSRNDPSGKEVAKNANGGNVVNVVVNIDGGSVNVSSNGK
jgi:hypothetical protein